MLGKLKDMTINRDGTQNVTVTVTSDFREEFDRLADTAVEITIKKASKKRSRDMNAFCWALCTDIANRMKLTKEEVYRRAIREVGEYTAMCMRAEAIETFQAIWSANGIGWFAEVVDDSREHPGYKWVFAYAGTSTYTVESMGRMLDYLVQDAEALGIPIPIGKEEQKRLLGAWTPSCKTASTATSPGGQTT